MSTNPTHVTIRRTMPNLAGAEAGAMRPTPASRPGAQGVTNEPGILRDAPSQVVEEREDPARDRCSDDERPFGPATPARRAWGQRERALAASVGGGPTIHVKSKPPCRKSLAWRKVARRAPENRSAPTNPHIHSTVAHPSPRPRRGGGMQSGSRVSHGGMRAVEVGGSLTRWLFDSVVWLPTLVVDDVL
jgi:hypothetical protein